MALSTSSRPAPTSSTCLPTIPGLYTERRLSPIQAGILCRESSWAELGSDLESASAAGSSEDLVGGGATGATTGTAVTQSSTITLSSHIAEPSTAADSITLVSATGTLA